MEGRHQTIKDQILWNPDHIKKMNYNYDKDVGFH